MLKDSAVETSSSGLIMVVTLSDLRPLLLVGPTGTGKSAYVQQKLMHDLPQDKYLATFINFSAQTSANMTQVLCEHCPGRRKQFNSYSSFNLKSTDIGRCVEMETVCS